MTSLYKETSTGAHGTFGIEITVTATPLPDLNQDQIRAAAYRAAALVKSEVMAAVIADSPDAKNRAREERSQILALFPSVIYVEDIPNRYCSDWCCRHLPWFVVTTPAGRFIIGWRKRVISIDWTQTQGTKTAEELFASEDVTKGGRSIHAWSLEKAQQYIVTIIAASEATSVPDAPESATASGASSPK